jgi:hypothetical protein
MDLNQNEEKKLEDVIPNFIKHPTMFSLVVKSIFGIIVFLSFGYYTLWLSTNYVKKDTFDSFISKQEQLFEARFQITQGKLENILNQQIITAEQFKNLNIILNSQQKSLDSLNERLTFIERNVYSKTITQPTK